MFNRKKKQAAAVRSQLEESLAEQAELEAQVAALDEANTHLDSRLAALDQGVTSISEELLKLTSANAATNQQLRSIDERVAAADIRVEAIGHRLGTVEGLTADLDEIDQDVSGIVRRDTRTPAARRIAATGPTAATSGHCDTAATTLHRHDADPVSPPPPPPADDSATDLDERVAELRGTLDALAEQTSSIDARVTSVSMELANQLHTDWQPTSTQPQPTPRRGRRHRWSHRHRHR